MAGWRVSAVIVVAAVTSPAWADRPLTGEDAAIIDWAVKNCEFKSTDREHGLVDDTRKKAEAVFNKQYMLQFANKAFEEAAADKDKKRRMCESIKEWYGPSGSRVPGLVSWAGAPEYAAPGGSPKSGEGRKGGGHGRHKGGS